MAKHWITPEGKYILGYRADIPPQNATEVPSAPPNETDIWSGSVWVESIPHKIQAQRLALEQSVTPRMLREAVSGSVVPNPAWGNRAAIAEIKRIDAQIRAL